MGVLLNNMENLNPDTNEIKNLLNDFINYLSEVHDEILNKPEKIKGRAALQSVILLHRKCVSLTESVTILAEHYKYSEALMINRNLFETGLLILYFIRYPFEAYRWLPWQDMSLEDKRKIPKNFENFCKYLEENGYNKTLQLLNKRNVDGLRNFKSSYIRSKALEHTQNEDKWEWYINFLNSYSHPTFRSQDLNVEFDKEEEIFVVTMAVGNLVLNTHCFISLFNQFISEELRNRFFDYMKKVHNHMKKVTLRWPDLEIIKKSYI